MSDDKPNLLERSARNLKAVACMFDSLGKIVRGLAYSVAAVGVVYIGYQGVRTYNGIKNLPSNIVSGVKESASNAWDNTWGYFSKDDEPRVIEIENSDGKKDCLFMSFGCGETEEKLVEIEKPPVVEVTPVEETSVTIAATNDGIETDVKPCKAWNVACRFNEWRNDDVDSNNADIGLDVEGSDLVPAN